VDREEVVFGVVGNGRGIENEVRSRRRPRVSAGGTGAYPAHLRSFRHTRSTAAGIRTGKDGVTRLARASASI
jgi:hypothetical protein